MFDTLPKSVAAIRTWTWDDIQPYVDDLLNRELTAESLDAWMQDQNALFNLLSENMARAKVANDQNTADEEAEAYLKNLYVTIFPKMQEVMNQLGRKMVASGLTPQNFELPLKKMKTDLELFRAENIPLNVQEQALGMQFGKIMSEQTVTWNGEEITVIELQKVLQNEDRATREKAWRAMMDRWLQDRDAINNIWKQLFPLRQQMAKNAGFDNYRDFRWLQLKRYDYSPADVETFHRAIEEVVVPAAERANERRRARLGVEALRPWDLDVDPTGHPPRRPYADVDDFLNKAEIIFRNVDPEIGMYFKTMRDEGLLDVPNRKNKGPGAYCTGFRTTRRPFIFMNAVGKRADVRTLLHESGHAFHGFETMANLPYMQQQAYPIEFAEVASMSMELLAAPYLTEDQGGYYTQADAARDRVEHLEKIIFFWPYMAVVDGFQQWAYTHGDAAQDPAACDDTWAGLWDRFNRVDYTGLDTIKATGWHRKHHIFRYPFYYVEYGLAQLGAVQVWANALNDQAEAVRNYRKALALGGTRSLPELFGAAGAKFAFDAETLGKAIELIENTIDRLEANIPA